MEKVYKVVTTRDKLRFDHTVLIARNLSNCRYKMAAQIFIGSRLISVGVNEIKTHTLFKRYPDHTVSIHAEAMALIKARTNVQGGTMYVARYGGNNSMPCPTCGELLKEAGIHTVVYMFEGEIVKAKL